jgi:tripartite-type tricarboxylate transporter receptor subunit TctC
MTMKSAGKRCERDATQAIPTWLLAAALVALSCISFAQSYPAKPISLVVPYPAGGRTDITARAVAQYLHDELGQPVIVVNKPGASGVLGAKYAVSAAADGYTLGFFSTGFLTTQYTVPAPTNGKDYELVALINFDPAAIAASAAKGWKTLAELVNYARRNPNGLRVGINAGGLVHVFAAAFCIKAGLDVVYVPFRGGAERTVALAGGHIDADFDIVAPMIPLMNAGKLKVLAIASDRRSHLYKDIPTMREQGVDLVISSWHGIFAPKGTPANVISALDGALEKVAHNPKFSDQMSALVLGIRYMNQREFTQFFAEQDALFKSLIDKLGLAVTPQ